MSRSQHVRVLRRVADAERHEVRLAKHALETRVRLAAPDRHQRVQVIPNNPHAKRLRDDAKPRANMAVANYA